MKKLDNYRFGHVDVEGEHYDTDVIVLGDWVHDWWRESGHRVVPEDLRDLMPKNPGRIVFGSGASSRMKLTPEVRSFLEERDVDYEALPTDEAIDRYNELVDEGETVAGAFHLTC